LFFISFTINEGKSASTEHLVVPVALVVGKSRPKNDTSGKFQYLDFPKNVRFLGLNILPVKLSIDVKSLQRLVRLVKTVLTPTTSI